MYSRRSGHGFRQVAAHGGGGWSAGAVGMLLDERAGGVDAAPVAAERVAVPGPGRLAFREVDGSWALGSERWSFVGQASPVFGDLAARVVPARLGTALRSAGATWMGRVRLDRMAEGQFGLVLFGYWPSETLDAEPAGAVGMFGPEGLLGVLPGMAFGATPLESWFDVAVQLDPEGGEWYLYRGPASGERWVLMFRTQCDTSAALYAGLTVGDVDGAVSLWRLLERPVWSFSPAVEVLLPAADADIAARSDLLLEWDGQFPSLTAGARWEMRYRLRDGANYWSVVAASDGASVDLQLVETLAGVATVRATYAGVQTAAGSRRYSLRVEGARHALYVRAQATSREISTLILHQQAAANGLEAETKLRYVRQGTASVPDLIGWPTAAA